eukprot:scpid87988/ scgid31416/ 
MNGEDPKMPESCVNDETKMKMRKVMDVIVFLCISLAGASISFVIGLNLIGVDPCDFDILHPTGPDCSGSGCNAANMSPKCLESDFLKQTELTVSTVKTGPLKFFRISGIIIVVFSVSQIVLQMFHDVMLCYLSRNDSVEDDTYDTRCTRCLALLAILFELVTTVAIIVCDIIAAVYFGRGVLVASPADPANPQSDCTCACTYKGGPIDQGMFMVAILFGFFRLFGSMMKKKTRLLSGKGAIFLAYEYPVAIHNLVKLKGTNGSIFPSIVEPSTT